MFMGRLLISSSSRLCPYTHYCLPDRSRTIVLQNNSRGYNLSCPSRLLASRRCWTHITADIAYSPQHSQQKCLHQHQPMGASCIRGHMVIPLEAADLEP